MKIPRVLRWSGLALGGVAAGVLTTRLFFSTPDIVDTSKSQATDSGQVQTTEVTTEPTFVLSSDSEKLLDTLITDDDLLASLAPEARPFVTMDDVDWPKRGCGNVVFSEEYKQYVSVGDGESPAYRVLQDYGLLGKPVKPEDVCGIFYGFLGGLTGDEGVEVFWINLANKKDASSAWNDYFLTSLQRFEPYAKGSAKLGSDSRLYGGSGVHFYKFYGSTDGLYGYALFFLKGRHIVGVLANDYNHRKFGRNYTTRVDLNTVLHLGELVDRRLSTVR